jgi:cyclopropane fatty-acyl-phospholipid synthase-like methyltransferase
MSTPLTQRGWTAAAWEGVRNWVLRLVRGRHEQIYDREYYKFIESTALSSREAMVQSIVRDLAPRHVLDVGCGTGALLDALRGRNVQAAGLEYSSAGLAYCRKRGLNVLKFDIGRHHVPTHLQRRDLVISFEVAEHLPASLADRFVDLLTSAGNVIVLSAATPGQGGTDHQNEQPHEYWIEKMAARGFRLDGELTQRWRAEWQGKTATWYHANVMVFRRATLQAQAA